MSAALSAVRPTAHYTEAKQHDIELIEALEDGESTFGPVSRDILSPSDFMGYFVLGYSLPLG